MASLELRLSQTALEFLRSVREVAEAIVAESGAGCSWVGKYLQRIAEDSIKRGVARENIYLSDRNRDLLIEATKREAVDHEFASRFQIRAEPKKLYESAGIRGATIALIASLVSLTLLLFMHHGLVRDAVVAALTVFSFIGSCVAWVGRRRATRPIA